MAEEKERKKGREKGKVEGARGRRETDGWGGQEGEVRRKQDETTNLQIF